MNKYLKWGFIALTVFIGLTVLGSFMGVFSSIATAPGRVIQKTLNTDNIIHSYEWFYDVNAAYTARVDQINQFKPIFKEETDKAERTRLRIDLAAMQQTCRTLTTKYNANSQKMNKSIFKGWELPQQLSISSCN